LTTPSLLSRGTRLFTTRLACTVKPFGIEADRGTLSPRYLEMPEAPRKQAEGSGWWPSVETEVEAKGAAHQGTGAAVFVAGVTALFSVLAMFDIRILPGFSPLSLVDAGLFAIVAWRIYRMSRAWALVGLLGYVSERAYSIMRMVRRRRRAGSSELSFCWASSMVCAAHSLIAGCPRLEIDSLLLASTPRPESICRESKVWISGKPKYKKALIGTSAPHTDHLRGAKS